MKTQKLILEISDSLFEQLQHLSELTEDSIESLAIRMIAAKIPTLTKEAEELNQLLANISPEKLHDEIDTGEFVGREVFW